MDRFAKKLFNICEPELLFRADERDGHARCIRPGCAADAVDVVFGVVGHIVIHDHIDVFHINAAGNHIGSYQNLNFLVAETDHDLFPFALFEIGMDLLNHDACLLQFAAECFRAAFPGTEDQDCTPKSIPEQILDQREFLGFIYRVGELQDIVGRF